MISAWPCDCCRVSDFSFSTQRDHKTALTLQLWNSSCRPSSHRKVSFSELFSTADLRCQVFLLVPSPVCLPVFPHPCFYMPFTQLGLIFWNLCFSRILEFVLLPQLSSPWGLLAPAWLICPLSYHALGPCGQPFTALLWAPDSVWLTCSSRAGIYLSWYPSLKRLI